jgi:ribosomal-protein-alanine N-acetyltransferase
VHFPGCTAFHQPASYVAFNLVTGQVAGIALSVFIAEDVAHIAELCVVPQFQGLGLGYELLRRSIELLRKAGARRISVTVTASNRGAVRLYTRCGFRQTRRFYAYVWKRVPSI